jgi:hypothetical protein
MLDDATFPDAGSGRGSLLRESSVPREHFGFNFCQIRAQNLRSAKMLNYLIRLPCILNYLAIIT